MSEKRGYPEMTEAFHARVTQTLAALEDKKMKKRRFIFRSGMAAVAVCAVCLVSVGAYAAVQWLHPKLVDVFDMDESQQQMVEEQHMVSDVDATATDNGLTVHAVQTLGDKNGAYILLALESEDEELLESLMGFETVQIEILGIENYNMGADFVSEYEQDADGNFVLDEYGNLILKPLEDGKRYYQIWLQPAYGEEGFYGKQISIELSQLLILTGEDPYAYDEYDIYEGTWELSWMLDFEDSTKTLELNKTIQILGVDVVVSEVEYSPLSERLVLTGEGLPILDEQYGWEIDEINFGMNIMIESFLMADGTVVTPLSGLGGNEYTDETRLTYISESSFESILDAENVIGIRLRTIPYDGETELEPVYTDVYF